MNISYSCFVDTVDSHYTRHLLEFEKNFDHWGTYWWFYYNWTMCFYFIAAYLIIIFAGQYYMKSRPPFQLRSELFLWNLVLALFSIFATWRLTTELVYTISHFGFSAAVCDFGSLQHKKAFGIWGQLFAYSKVLELGDTAFIVLRKTPLIFLHWYHHISVLFLVWSSGAWPSTIQLWFATVNVIVHSIMYSYYALRAIRVKIPRKISMAITMLQMVQMVLGLFIIIYASWLKHNGVVCCTFDQAIWLALGVYASYLVLFGNYFLKTYILKKAPSDKKIQ